MKRILTLIISEKMIPWKKINFYAYNELPQILIVFAAVINCYLYSAVMSSHIERIASIRCRNIK